MPVRKTVLAAIKKKGKGKGVAAAGAGSRRGKAKRTLQPQEEIKRQWIEGFKITKAKGMSFYGSPPIRYRVGKTYKMPFEKLEMCKRGFHFSPTILDCVFWCRAGASMDNVQIFKVKAPIDAVVHSELDTLPPKLVAAELAVTEEVDFKLNDQLMTGWSEGRYFHKGYFLFENYLDDDGTRSLESKMGSVRFCKMHLTELSSLAEEEAGRIVAEYVPRYEADMRKPRGGFKFYPNTGTWVCGPAVEYVTPVDESHLNFRIWSSKSHVATLEEAIVLLNNFETERGPPRATGAVQSA